MEKLYRALNFNQFLYAVIGVGIFTDLIILSYCYTLGTDQAFFLHALGRASQIVSQAGTILPPDFEGQLFQLWLRTLKLFLGLIILYHGLIYFLWFKKKNYARSYLALYSWISGPTCLLGGFSLLLSKPLWSLAIILCGLGLLFTALGLKRFPFKKTGEQ